MHPPSEKQVDAFGFDLPDDKWLERLRRGRRPEELGRLGSYELQEEIGRGAQGVVYRARQPNTGRIVALKSLGRGSFATADMRKRFERELRAELSLDHPNIVRVLGMELIDGQPLLVMQWIDGVPVDRWVRERVAGTPVRESLGLFLKIADAVHHAHQRGVIHRDLKPSNILVDADGEPHVLDFGLAKMIEDDSSAGSLTMTRDFLGTPAYAAPEQVCGEHASVDVRTDVYALGVILYQMVSGRLPHPDTGNLAALLDAVRHLDPPPPSRATRPSEELGRRLRAIDGELDAIVMKALSKEPARRYPSVDAFAADVRRYLCGEPILAAPPNRLYRLRKALRVHRAAALTGAAIALLLVTAVIGTSAGLARALAAETRAQQRADDLGELVAFLESQLADVDIVLLYSRSPGSRQQALPHLREALRQREQVLGPESPHTLSAMLLLGATLVAQGEAAEAEEHLRFALAGAREVLADDDPLLIGVLCHLDASLNQLGRLEEAEAFGAEATRLARIGATNPVSMAAVPWLPYVFYGDTLQAMNRFEQAERILLEAHALRGAGFAKYPRAGAPIRKLIELYEAWHAAEPEAGHDAKAAEWRTKRQAIERPLDEPDGVMIPQPHNCAYMRVNGR